MSGHNPSEKSAEKRKTTNIFIMAVGTRDPYWSGAPGWPQRELTDKILPGGNGISVHEGPILSFFRTICEEPQRIYLFTTGPGEKVRQPTVERGESTKKVLMTMYPWAQVETRVLTSLDPSDYAECYTRLREEIEKITAENGRSQSVQYITNLSPGTPQMGVALAVLHKEGKLPGRLFQTKENVGAVEVSLAPLFEDELKKVVLSLMETYSYRAASQVLASLAGRSNFPERREIANVLANATEAYYWREQFRYDQAARLMRAAATLPGTERMPARLRDLLQAQWHTLQNLGSGKAALRERLLDQYHVATLKHARGEEAVSIQHCYRIVEQLEEVTEQSRGVPPSLQAEREWLRKIRNAVAHEPRGGSKESAERALKFIESLLVCKWQNVKPGIREYPFCLSQLKLVLDYVENQL